MGEPSFPSELFKFILNTVQRAVTPAIEESIKNNLGVEASRDALAGAFCQALAGIVAAAKGAAAYAEEKGVEVPIVNPETLQLIIEMVDDHRFGAAVSALRSLVPDEGKPDYVRYDPDPAAFWVPFNGIEIREPYLLRLKEVGRNVPSPWGGLLAEDVAATLVNRFVDDIVNLSEEALHQELRTQRRVSFVAAKWALEQFRNQSAAVMCERIGSLIVEHLGSDRGNTLEPIAKVMEVAGISAQLIHATRRTGLVITSDNQNEFSDEDKQRWSKAIDEYYVFKDLADKAESRGEHPALVMSIRRFGVRLVPHSNPDHMAWKAAIGDWIVRHPGHDDSLKTRLAQLKSN